MFLHRGLARVMAGCCRWLLFLGINSCGCVNSIGVADHCCFATVVVVFMKENHVVCVYCCCSC